MRGTPASASVSCLRNATAVRSPPAALQLARRGGLGCNRNDEQNQSQLRASGGGILLLGVPMRLPCY